MTVTEMKMRMTKWGTWEELVLGSAVLRHGVRAWDAVAAELRARTLFPNNFTAEVCKAKYEDLQQRYCGCTAWFEELRKQRVAELKRELEKSEDSIGSLETKLESLKAERAANLNPKYESSNTESPASIGNCDGVELSGKDTSKDGLSAGSFTEETRLPVPPAKTDVIKTEIKGVDEGDNGFRTIQIIGSNVRKRIRGKRKRKDCSKDVIKEGSVGDNDVGTSIDHHVAEDRDVEESTGDVDRTTRSDDRVADDLVEDDLMRVLNSVEKNENASAFRRRLDRQKRARYKKTIRRHLNFETIRSRISDGSIKSPRELHRDLLLLCNNAIVFYPKDSREHKSAGSLRYLLNKTFRNNQQVSGNESGGATDPPAEKPADNSPPVKARIVCLNHRKVNGVRKVAAEVTPTPSESTKARDAEFPVAGKRGVVRSPGKSGSREAGRKGPEPAAKGRKRIRKK